MQFPLQTPVKLTQELTDIQDARDLDFGNGCLCVITAVDGGTFAMYAVKDGGLLQRGKLTGLGATVRQLRVSGTVAVVTARSFGAYFIDISDPDAPQILYHYDTVEFATGVAVDGNMAYIACRQMGVEAIDISDPRHPGYVSTLRAGEVQSVRVQDGILYAGAWNQRMIQLFDVHDPGLPRFLSSIPLSGKGDGLFVQDGILYAAMGQHTGEILKPKSTDPGYGWGNGLAIVDVHDPLHPVKLSEYMLPYAYYYCNFDMWSTLVCGHYCIMAHTFNGILLFDVADPKNPVLVSHTPIPASRPACEMMDLSPYTKEHYPMRLPFDPEKESYAPVTGIAACEGMLFAAVGKDALRIIPSTKYFSASNITAHSVTRYSDYNALCPGEQTEGVAFVRVDGQVHEITALNGKLYAACGNGGLRVFDANTTRLLSTVDTVQPVRSVRTAAGKLYTACTTAGVKIYEPEGDSLRLLGTYATAGETYQQVVPTEDGRFVMTQVNGTTLLILDVSDPTHPVEVVRDRHRPSLIYHRQITVCGAGGRYYAGYWADKRTVHWYDLSGEKPAALPHTQYGLNFRMGLTGLPDGRILLPARERGYVLAFPEEPVDIQTSPSIPVAGTRLDGKPWLCGNVLAVSDTMLGYVRLVDISDLEHPRFLRELQFSGHPDLGCRVDDRIFIPLHYEGIGIVEL